MNTHTYPVRTAADVLAMLAAADLPPLRRRDLVSAVNRVSEIVGCDPALLSLDVPALRGQLAAIRPAAEGISPKTLSNLRTLFARALEWAGIVAPLGRGRARRDPAWAPLLAGTAHGSWLANGLDRVRELVRRERR